MKLPISATIIARNEEIKITKCLDSIKNIVDEIVFVHDGPCDDKTIEIAKKYTNKIFTPEYIGEAEPHRKFALDNSKYNWILQIDADEYLTEELKAKIPELINNEDVSGYLFKWNVAYINEPKKFQYKLAVFQKNKITNFYGIPHEAVQLKGNTLQVDAELGHDRIKGTTYEQDYKMTVWPRVQGKYMAKYKYKQIPNWFLPFGYLFYPSLIVLGQIRRREYAYISVSIRSFKYSFRVWDSFYKHRINEKQNAN